MSNYTSTGCPAHLELPHDPVPLFSNGNINFKAHEVGWLICLVLTIVATIASAWLILKHLAFFYMPHQQRYIVRLLFMVPIYAICSFFSYFYYKQALYFQLLRDCYEALVIASFFQLLIAYLSAAPRPTPEEPFPRPYALRREREEALMEAFREVRVGKWLWPFGWVKWRPAGGGPNEGQAFMWWMRVGIGQSLLNSRSEQAAVLGEATGYYCLASWSPKFVHVWASGAITISVTIAMYCVLQVYWPLREELKPYSPILKFLSVKAVVFLTFWQELSLTFLVTLDVIKNQQYWSAEEIVIGFAAILSTFEMMIFAFVHIKAFTYLPYRALAPPLVPPESEDASIDEKEELPSTLAGLQRYEMRKAQLAAEEQRLVPIRQSTKKKPLITTKPDGLPVLRQTRRWPALWKCVKLTDIARELHEESRFLARRPSKVGGVGANRGRDMEEVFGQKRPKPTSASREAEEEEEDEEAAKTLHRILPDRPIPRDSLPSLPYGRVMRAGHPDRTQSSESRHQVARKHEEQAGWWEQRNLVRTSTPSELHDQRPMAYSFIDPNFGHFPTQPSLYRPPSIANPVHSSDSLPRFATTRRDSWPVANLPSTHIETNQPTTPYTQYARPQRMARVKRYSRDSLV